MNYHVADYIIRIKNASKARRKEVVMPYSNIAKAIGKVLVKEGFVAEVKEETVANKKVLRTSLRYVNRKPAVSDVLIVSKPSLRVYAPIKEVMQNQLGKIMTVVISTSKGIMTGKEAQKKGIGGEVLFQIW